MAKKIKTVLGITPANDTHSSQEEIKNALKMTGDAIKKTTPGSVEHKVLARKYEILKSHIKESSHLLNKKVMTIDQLAKKHKVAPSHIAKQLKMGIKVEKEHTTFFSAAKKIALAHLGEDPNYYTKLKKVERK